MKVIICLIFLTLGLLFGFVGWSISDIEDTCIFATICQGECGVGMFINILFAMLVMKTD